MSIENPIRREIGLPANRSTKRVTQNQDVLDDPGQKRFVQGKDLKGKTVFYDRQSRLQNPETRERMQQIREGSLKFNPQTGWEKASDVNALINLRARGKYEEALKRIKERVGFNKMPKKLAASELKKTPIEYDEAEAHYLGDTYLASPSKQFGQYRHIATYSVGPDKFHHIYNDTLNNEIIHQLTDSESPWRAKNVFSDIVGKLRNDGSLQITTASVDPEHKGKGYGKTLYAQALAYHGKIHSDELVSRMANKVYSYLKDIGAKVKMGAPNTRERHEAVSTPEMKQKIGWKDDEELAASEKFCKVSSPKKGHTIAQLERLKQDNWYNPDTGTELDAEEAERYLWQMRQNKADKKVARTLRALKEPKKSNEKPEDWFGDSELSKMSRPRITFPNLKRITTRPDQEVQLIESGRQKDILGRKIVQSFLKDPKERQKIANLSPKQKEKVYADNAKYHTAKFSNKTLGFMSPTPSGPISSTLAGKLRSKFEEGDEKDQAKLDAWKQKRAEIINNYHEAIEKWRQEGQNLTGEALSEHLKKRPQKPKLPRRPSKSLKATKDLPRDRMEARGRSLSATIEHEGFHHILDQIKNQYGPIAQQKVRDKLLEQHDPEAIKHLSAYVQHGLGYKPNSFFNEELLAHARDILVNPKKRQNFKKFIQTSMYGTLNFSDEDFTNLISKLKRGHQKAYQVAQNLKEEDLLVPGQSVTKSSITKEEQPLDVNFPDEISLKYATHRWEK
jgi:ribosomal protein S18 acetylase RimI-like enzyme